MADLNQKQGTDRLHGLVDDEHLARANPNTGYIENIDQIIEKHYPNLQGTTYLDHAGTTTYPNSLIEAYATDLKSNLFGNPHSAAASSQLSSRRIDELRVRVLRFLDADPDEFDLVFVANATAAIKLVADAFRDLDEGFWYGYHHDVHTSLVGVRELAIPGSMCMNDTQVDAFLREGGTPRVSDKSAILFAYSGQSNMTGQRYSLEWCRQINQRSDSGKKHIYSMYDAAGLLSTNCMSLSDSGIAPDFTVLSFYKIFGFPDLGGLVVRKSSAGILKTRKYFGGGTVDAVSIDGVPWHAKRDQLHAALEDGTPPFHTIIALDHAMKLYTQIFGGMVVVAQHTSSLASRAYDQMASLRHANGRPLCVMYSGNPSDTKSSNGPIVTFNLVDDRGTYISNSEVEKLGIVNNIQFRTGGLCNPGGTSRYLDLTTDQVKGNYHAGLRCGGGGGSDTIINNKPTGTIRISFGGPSSMKDVDTFISFLGEFFLDRNTSVVGEEKNSFSPNGETASFVIDSMTVFPVKSCGGFSIPRHVSWKVYPKGLEFDREWCLVHRGTGIALSQKQFPRMALLKPSINLDGRTLTITSVYNTTPSSIIIDLDNFPASEAVMSKSCRRFKSQNSTVCGEAILVHVYTSRAISDFFTNALGVPCTLARFPPEEIAPVRRVNIRRPLSTPEPSPERHTSAGTREIGLKLSNESPILLVSRSSVDKLNAQVQARSQLCSGSGSANPFKDTLNGAGDNSIRISAESFRANIVIAEPSRTSSPYIEDTFTQLHIRSRSRNRSGSDAATSTSPSPSPSRFTVLGPCQRCQMVCVDQQSGMRNHEPFSTLAKTRRRDGRVWFGMHMCLDELGPVSLRVGDLVDAEHVSA